MRRYAVKFSDGETAIIDEPTKRQAKLVADYIARQQIIKVVSISFVKRIPLKQ
jgi:hypothetical protein